MGDVYEAEHDLLGVRRALKVLSRKMAGREDLAERLRIEARALAQLRHPNLVQVHDLGVSSDGRVFFAMELLEGATLRELLHRLGRLKPDQAIAIATQVLDALGAAHAQGMVHRDVKPENIFVLTSGTIKLLDFGVAKAMQGSSSQPQLTAAGMAVGTPRYMAPEQAEGKPVDARSDLYGVGIVLWEMLAGHAPYQELDAVAAAIASVTRGVPSLQHEGVDAPIALIDAITRATARVNTDRFPDAASFSAELRLTRPRCSLLPSPSEKKTVRYDEATTSLMPLISSDSEDDNAVLNRALEEFERTSQTPVQTHELLAIEPFEGLTEVELPTLVDLRSLPTPTSVELAARVSTPDVMVAFEGSALPTNRTTTPALIEGPGSQRPTIWLVVPAVALLTALLTAWVVRPASDDVHSLSGASVERNEGSTTALQAVPAQPPPVMGSEVAVTAESGHAGAGDAPTSPRAEEALSSTSAAPDSPKAPGTVSQAAPVKRVPASKPSRPVPVGNRSAGKKTGSGLPSSGL